MSYYIANIDEEKDFLKHQVQISLFFLATSMRELVWEGVMGSEGK